MAAIDPDAEPQFDEDQKHARATLKLIRIPDDFDMEDDDDEDYEEGDIEAIAARLRAAGALPEADSDLSDDDSEDEKNGGPSDPAKSKKAKQAALTKKMQEELEADDMDIDSLTNGAKGKAKGKAKVTDDDLSDEDDEDDEDDDDEDEPEELVLCTLDPEKVRLLITEPARCSTNFHVALPAASRHHCPPGRGGLPLCHRHARRLRHR